MEIEGPSAGLGPLPVSMLIELLRSVFLTAFPVHVKRRRFHHGGAAAEFMQRARSGAVQHGTISHFPKEQYLGLTT